MAAKITAAGVTCYEESYSHRTPQNWKIVLDASVHGGFEVVSPILSGPEGLEQVRLVSEALIGAGAKVDKECGLHVHVDARDLNTPTLINLTQRYSTHEGVIDAFMPRSRRANQYCLSMTDVLSSIKGKKNLSPRALVSGLYEDRYRKLNLCAFLRHGTVEFRQHSGTVESKKMIPWIIFCLNFVETSIVTEDIPAFGAVDAASATLRKNAIEKKFRALAVLLQNTSKYDCASLSQIAVRLDVPEASVANYISRFRAKHRDIIIKMRQGFGYYVKIGRDSIRLVATGTPSVQVTPTYAALVDTGPFMGLSSDLQSYFHERTMDLANA